MLRLGEAIKGVIERLPETPRTAAELARSLGVNRKLAWQAWRIAFARTAEDYPDALPGPAALAGLTRAADIRGVPASVLSGVEDAVRGLESLALVHSDDRASLLSMLRWAAPPEAATITEAVRRQAFQANSDIWGLQSRALFTVALLAPGSAPDRVDDLTLSGDVGIRRMRPGAARVVTGLGFRNAGDPAGPPRPRALAPLDGDHRDLEPILSEFSTSPLPLIRSRQDEPGQTRVELADRPVGRSGEVTLVLGQICENVGYRHRSDKRHEAHFVAHIHQPYAVLYSDVMVRRDLWGPIKTRVRVYSAVRGVVHRQAERLDADLLPIGAEVASLGRGLGVVVTPDLPRHAELVAWACARVGWAPEQFEAYRVRIAFPPMPSTVVLSVELPRP